MSVSASDTDVAIIFGSFFLGLVLHFVKLYFHFQYLKSEQGYFKDAEFVSIIANPFRGFKYLPELFIIHNFPILWNLKGNPYRYKAGIFTYLSLAFLAIAIIYFSLLGD